ncbi:uncharacterized protein LOC130702106 [Daphnia carinata]|uniref:uncharacterized protein LOC130702106 n=1 Tax=Daphnia carinata TaxID=120202 RepID=UPI00257FE8AF|nr:uncharacterized protein LOC130702106 [Daphnia carinata]
MQLPFTLAVFAMVFTVINCYTDEEAWNDYKKKHGKNYRFPFDGGRQDRIRRALFQIRSAEINKHNSENSDTYRLEVNKFTDMAPIELDDFLGIKAGSVPRNHFVEANADNVESRQIPTSLDYRYNKCLPAIKNQGQCGSCWAFSAIAPLEFAKCKKTGTAVVLSEQQLVDCDRSNGGCSGGWYVDAWNYTKRAGGSARKSSYDYTATVGTCKFSSWMVGANVSSFGYVASKNEAAMQSALVKYGPLPVAMNVVPSLYSYASGVYSDTACDGPNVNHGVVVVGWGVLNGKKFWMVRNSWGTNWGLAGYFRIQRGVNKCNIETYPAYVVPV